MTTTLELHVRKIQWFTGLQWVTMENTMSSDVCVINEAEDRGCTIGRFPCFLYILCKIRFTQAPMPSQR